MKMQIFSTSENVKADIKYKRLKLGGGQDYARSKWLGTYNMSYMS
jgi:hypothetical protein